MTTIERMKEIAESYGLKLEKVEAGNGGIKINVNGQKKALAELGYESLFKTDLIIEWTPSTQIIQQDVCFSNSGISALAA